jgi:hypothetical protein
MKDRADILADHFEYQSGVLSAYVCKHCGSLTTIRHWELHVIACPALAKWVREQESSESQVGPIGHG